MLRAGALADATPNIFTWKLSCLHAVEDLRFQSLSLLEAHRIRQDWGARSSLGVSSRVAECVEGSSAEGRRVGICALRTILVRVFGVAFWDFDA